MRSLAITDDLTGFFNRRGFLAAAAQQLKLAHRDNLNVLLLFCDLDNLKESITPSGITMVTSRSFARRTLSRKLSGIQICVGVARYDPINPLPLAELMARADHDMYQNKRQRAHAASSNK